MRNDANTASGQVRTVQKPLPQTCLVALYFLPKEGAIGATKNLSRTGFRRFPLQYGGGFLKIISVGIPTYAGMKTGFYADFSPRNRFSRRHRSECRQKKIQSWALSVFFNFFNNKNDFFAFFIKLILLGVGFLNRPGAEIGY